MLSYSGHSMIIDPRGEVLADAGEHEGVIKAEIDMQALTQYRREFPFLNDIHHEYVKTQR